MKELFLATCTLGSQFQTLDQDPWGRPGFPKSTRLLQGFLFALSALQFYCHIFNHVFVVVVYFSCSILKEQFQSESSCMSLLKTSSNHFFSFYVSYTRSLLTSTGIPIGLIVESFILSSMYLNYFFKHILKISLFSMFQSR